MASELWSCNKHLHNNECTKRVTLTSTVMKWPCSSRRTSHTTRKLFGQFQINHDNEFHCNRCLSRIAIPERKLYTKYIFSVASSSGNGAVRPIKPLAVQIRHQRSFVVLTFAWRDKLKRPSKALFGYGVLRFPPSAADWLTFRSHKLADKCTLPNGPKRRPSN